MIYLIIIKIKNNIKKNKKLAGVKTGVKTGVVKIGVIFF